MKESQARLLVLAFGFDDFGFACNVVIAAMKTNSPSLCLLPGACLSAVRTDCKHSAGIISLHAGGVDDLQKGVHFVLQNWDSACCVAPGTRPTGWSRKWILDVRLV